MSKADEMFEKMNYKKAEIGCFIQYNIIEELVSITFDMKNRTVSKTKGYNSSIPFTMQELNAINEKVKELGFDE